jgi:hypothetical protein
MTKEQTNSSNIFNNSTYFKSNDNTGCVVLFSVMNAYAWIKKKKIDLFCREGSDDCFIMLVS